MSLDAFSELGELTIVYECDHCWPDGDPGACDRQVRGSKRMLCRPPTDWWVGVQYGLLRVYCPNHRPEVTK